MPYNYNGFIIYVGEDGLYHIKDPSYWVTTDHVKFENWVDAEEWCDAHAL